MKECDCKFMKTCDDNMAYPGNCSDYQPIEKPPSPKFPVDKLTIIKKSLMFGS